MKKSNVIVTAIIVVLSAFLLWLWYSLGLNTVDQPLDLVVSVVWWALVAIGAGLMSFGPFVELIFAAMVAYTAVMMLKKGEEKEEVED